MNRRHKEIASIFSLVLCLTTAPTAARTGDRSERAEFRAGQSRENAGVMEFSRGFQLNQGSLEIKSDSARVIRNNKGELLRIELVGQPALWVEQLDDGSPLTAQARRIDYDLVEQQVTLTNDARVKKSGDELAADTILYNLKTQQLEAGGDGDEPVLFFYTPPARDPETP